MKKIFTFSLFILFAVGLQAQIRYLKGNLQASQEIPATASTGGGVVIVKYDVATKTLELVGNYSGLTDTITMSHIHQGSPGVIGPVIVPLAITGGLAGTIKGKAVVSQNFEDSLLAGNTYANVHSKSVPGGELRAQLTQTTLGQTEFFTGRIQGAQQAPPNASTATGNVTVILDKVTLQVFVTADFHKLADSASASHLHRHPVGLSGPVVVPLSTTRDTSGTSWGTAIVTSGFADSMLAGNTYYNVHNKPFGGGEIRAQLLPATGLRYFGGVLDKSQEVPATTSAGRGTVIVRYNTQTNFLELTGDYQNLSSAATVSHIHGPAGPGSNADPLFDVANTGGTMGTLTVTSTLTETQEATLLAGNMYVNVHTVTNPAGEIRAQLLPTSSGESQYLTCVINAAQSVPNPAGNPPIVSNAVGKGTVLYDKVTRKIYVTGSYSNLVTGINNSHIHRHPVGQNGPVVVPLLFINGTTSGTVTSNGSPTVSATFADSLINGFTYLNIHTTGYPNGEIRGQLGDLVLPVKLEYFNGYKDQNKVVVIWQSAQELNVKHYEVEQQNEAGDWIKKGTIAAKGGSLAMKYTFNDVPLIGKKDYLLYRLKTVDLNGTLTYSSVIKIVYSTSQAALTIMQNPVINGNLVVTITGLANEQKAEISVIDFTGRLLKKNIVSTLSNNVIDVSKLSSGMYKVLVKLNDSVLHQSFSKQ